MEAQGRQVGCGGRGGGVVWLKHWLPGEELDEEQSRCRVCTPDIYIFKEDISPPAIPGVGVRVGGLKVDVSTLTSSHVHLLPQRQVREEVGQRQREGGNRGSRMVSSQTPRAQIPPPGGVELHPAPSLFG